METANEMLPDMSPSSPNWISAAEEVEHRPSPNDDEDSSDEFEFSFMADRGQDVTTADEIFSNGRILPVYPLFNRDLLTDGEDKTVRIPLGRLLLEERETLSRSETTSSSSSVDDLEGVPPETFCLWEPRSAPSTPDRVKKSRSTGSVSRRWRFKDLVVGRSHSDGKEKFGFLAGAEENKKEKGATASPGRARATEVDMVTAHRLYYAKSGGDGWRRTFLPYKQDLVGLFGNVNGGLSRAHHPF